MAMVERSSSDSKNKNLGNLLHRQKFLLKTKGRAIRVEQGWRCCSEARHGV